MGAQRNDETPDRTDLRASIERLGLYQSLALLLVPAGVVEPLKLVAVAIAGDGHWITGTAMMVVAYAASLLIVERLFRIVKPKLLTLPWFATERASSAAAARVNTLRASSRAQMRRLMPV